MKTQTMRKALSVAALVVGLGAFTNAGAAVINGVNWSNVYDPDFSTYNFLPNAATPVWTLSSAGNSTATITSNYLTISDTNAISDNLCYINTNNWNMTNGMTVEANLQMVTSLGGATKIAQIRLGNATNYIYLGFDKTSISYFQSGVYTAIANGLDLSTGFATVRMTLASNLDLNIYVNNNSTPVGTLTSAAFTSGGGANAVLFGDASGTAGGTSNWDYIAYTAGVFPVPEPSSMVLFSLGLLPIYFVVHRKRRSGSKGLSVR
jgi:hypothetical protein